MENCKYGPLMEEWRDVIGYEGLYSVSNYGMVLSVGRVAKRNNLSKYVSKTLYIHERILKRNIIDGYPHIVLQFEGKRKTSKIHQIMFFAFNLDEEKRKVPNHKNGIRDDNFILNIEASNQRENNSSSVVKASKKTSKYVGVCLIKTVVSKPWLSQIQIDKIKIRLGTYSTEEEASVAYKKALVDYGVINKYG